MNPNTSTPTLSLLLKEKLAERMRKNPRYSMRAFAVLLGLSPGGLSRVLSGDIKLSVERAKEIAGRLGLTPEESQDFELTAELDSTKNPTLRGVLIDRLNQTRGPLKIADLSVDQFMALSDWYHLAVLECIHVTDLKYSAEKIAAFLGISVLETQLALERLVRLGLLTHDPKSGHYARVKNRLIVDSVGQSNPAVHRYYRQVLERSLESIERQSPQEKVLGTDVFAFDIAHIEKARTLTHQYLDQMVALSKQSTDKKNLYQLAVQFFRLNPLEGKTGKTTQAAKTKNLKKPKIQEKKP